MLIIDSSYFIGSSLNDTIDIKHGSTESVMSCPFKGLVLLEMHGPTYPPRAEEKIDITSLTDVPCLLRA